MTNANVTSVQRVVILGAAGRDFHNFNIYFRDNPQYVVVAFTATQIPNIAGRLYPPALAGPRYPQGIPIVRESDLAHLIATEQVDLAHFAYSDVSYEHVMQVGARAMAAGAGYLWLSPRQTMLKARVPVIAVCASRTGAGKSQTSRRVAQILQARQQRVVIVRHPMPYGDLAAQAVQRFATLEDLDRYQVTIEEREDYEPHVQAGFVVYAGVDYERILRQAEEEADIIIWDGGNNDWPFFAPDLWLTVVDPHRADHALRYYPGEINVRMADVIVINKIDTASFEQVEATRRIAYALKPTARMVDAASPVTVEDGEAIRGKRVLVVEDGPTITHGEMAYGAGWVAATRHGAAEIVDPRPYATGALATTFANYPRIGPVLPAMGYGPAQIADLAATIAAVPADLVLVATPIDLRRVLTLSKPAQRVRYELQEIGEPTLTTILQQFLAERGQ
ncbi:MAG: GTPase [Caldilinea sp. CFX5]|nr:GTPase [Caldilinea sp. CFX5]